MNSTATAAYVEPILKTMVVQAKPEHAFEVFTAGMGRWWLRNCSINPTKSPIAEVVIEPRVGGRWFERGSDGSECDWGKVLVWEPSRRLVLAWQINAQWQFDPALTTEVEVNFNAQSSKATKITLEHRKLERYGDSASVVRDGLGGGWGGLLERYAAAVADMTADKNYRCEFTANVTAKEAFKGISRVSEWWAKNFEGSAQNLNDVFTVRFGETFVTFKLTEVIPDAKVVWTITDCYLHWLKDKTEWTNTKVVWEISEKNKSTEINFTHVGLVPEIECYEACIKGWDEYVKGSLPKLLTENKGLPD